MNPAEAPRSIDHEQALTDAPIPPSLDRRDWELAKISRSLVKEGWNPSGLHRDARDILIDLDAVCLSGNDALLVPDIPLRTYAQHMEREHGKDPARLKYVMQKSNPASVAALDETIAKYNGLLASGEIKTAGDAKSLYQEMVRIVQKGK